MFCCMSLSLRQSDVVALSSCRSLFILHFVIHLCASGLLTIDHPLHVEYDVRITP